MNWVLYSFHSACPRKAIVINGNTISFPLIRLFVEPYVLCLVSTIFVVGIYGFILGSVLRINDIQKMCASFIKQKMIIAIHLTPPPRKRYWKKILQSRGKCFLPNCLKWKDWISIKGLLREVRGANSTWIDILNPIEWHSKSKSSCTNCFYGNDSAIFKSFRSVTKFA